MMNKLKYIFLMILCAGIIGGASVNISTQSSDKVLVSAKRKTLRQSDGDKLIEFYEWAFQAEFNSTQGRDFQGYTEQEFRANPSESRATVDDIVKTLPQILAADQDVQNETRQMGFRLVHPRRFVQSVEEL